MRSAVAVILDVDDLCDSADRIEGPQEWISQEHPLEDQRWPALAVYRVLDKNQADLEELISSDSQNTSERKSRRHDIHVLVHFHPTAR